jgi:hypothetical protein
MIDTTELISPYFRCFGRIWKLTVSANILIVLYGSQFGNSENSELPDSSKTVKLLQRKRFCGLTHSLTLSLSYE